MYIYILKDRWLLFGEFLTINQIGFVLHCLFITAFIA